MKSKKEVSKLFSELTKPLLKKYPELTAELTAIYNESDFRGNVVRYEILGPDGGIAFEVMLKTLTKKSFKEDLTTSFDIVHRSQKIIKTYKRK